MSFEYSCPYCSKSISIDPNSPPEPKFKAPKEQVAYNKKRKELQKRCKESFICPQCNGELVVFMGNVFKCNDVSEELYNKVFCNFCDKEISFTKSYKEIKGTAVGYTFYCKDCARKNTFRWMILIAFVFVLSLVVIFYLY